jgi:uroporphyrinogen decarboxylase
MNSMERTVAAVRFGKPDRTPVMPQVFGHAATVAGVALDDYIRDGQLLARCQLQARERYGEYDAVFAVMDVNVETEALGSILKYRRNAYATVDTFALSPGDDWGRLSLPDPERAGRMPEMLKALQALRRELQDTVPIVGCVVGPLTLTTQLLGIETALYLAIDEPERFARLMDFSTEVLIRFGQAQLEAGAHLPIVFDPSASPAVVPARFFREFELPRLAKLFAAFKQAGALLNWLHIAGPAESILSFYPQAGVDLANLDYFITPQNAMERLPGTCVDGNLKPLAFVASEPGEIHAAAVKLLQAFAERSGFVLSSGCEIPPEAKPENVAALVMAVRNAE